jgi:uncharacterized protein
VTADLIVPVRDLLGSPGRERPFSGERNVKLRLGESSIDGPMQVDGVVIGMIDGVLARFRASAIARLTCTRCLVEWEAPVSVAAEQVFGRIPDEDGYGIFDDEVDVGGPATDELALALPAAPVCRDDCRGLCPTCGTDLNTDPCDGHGETTESPFAALKDLFDH